MRTCQVGNCTEEAMWKCTGGFYYCDEHKEKLGRHTMDSKNLDLFPLHDFIKRVMN